MTDSYSNSTKNSKKINKQNYHIYIPIKSFKDPKNDPTNPIHKYVNKYNSKNKKYYKSNSENSIPNYTYISNSDVYI